MAIGNVNLKKFVESLICILEMFWNQNKISEFAQIFETRYSEFQVIDLLGPILTVVIKK